MNGKGCDNPDGYVVNDNQIYSLYYDYSPQIQGSRDHCDVSLRTSLTIRRLKYYVTTLDLLDCGVEILVYYNPSISATPTVIFLAKLFKIKNTDVLQKKKIKSVLPQQKFMQTKIVSWPDYKQYC